MQRSRAVTAIAMGASLWFGSISSFAAQQENKDQTQPSTQSQAKKDASKSTQTQPQQQQTASRKPLSTGEDPTMIGKRNINKGIWAGGILGAKGVDSEV